MTRIRPIRRLRSIPHKRWIIVGALGLALVGLNIYSRYQPMSAVIIDSENSWLVVSFVDGYLLCVLTQDSAPRDRWLLDKRRWTNFLTNYTRWKKTFRITRHEDQHHRTTTPTRGGILVANQLFLLAILAIYPLIAGLCALVRHRRRVRTNHCTRCAYCLTGNVTGICSECGTPIAATTAGAAAP